MKVIIADFSSVHRAYNRWDDFIGLYPDQATIFHTSEWINTLQTAFGFIPKIILAMEERHQSYRAAMPFMIDRRFGIENWLSMPFDTYGGVIGDMRCSNAIKTRFFDCGFKGVRYCVDFHSFPVEKENCVTTEIMNISEEGSYLWNHMHKDNRTSIRAAMKNGISVEQSKDTLQYRGVPDNLVQAIVNIMIPSGKCAQFVAKLDGNILASSLFFIYGKQAMYWANTVTEEGRKTNANYLLMWEAIRNAKWRGCVEMNLGASPASADSLLRFKRSWKTTSFAYTKIQKVPTLLKPVLKIREVFHG